MSDDRGRRPGPASGSRTTAVQRVLDAHAEQRRTALGRPLRVLDLGGGTGGTAVPLAVAGHELTVVDPSPDALFSLRRRASERGVEARVRALQGDADTVASLVGADEPFDLVCLHGTLEVVDDPAAAVGAAAGLLAPGAPSASSSRSACTPSSPTPLPAGSTGPARSSSAPTGAGARRIPRPGGSTRPPVVALVEAQGLTPVHVQGVRVFADLVPSALLDSEADRTALAALEEARGGRHAHPVLGSLGSALHVLATRG